MSSTLKATGKSTDRTIGLALVSSLLLGLSSCSPEPFETNEINKTEAPPGSTPGVVTILGQFSEEDGRKFEQSLIPFEKRTGIDVIYQTTDDFNSLLRMRIASFYEPDLAVLPQPGLMNDLVEGGHLVPLTEFMSPYALKSAYPDRWLDLGAVDDVPYGLWYRISLQSLVWYRPTAFEGKGYDIPNTWNELNALADQIVADGGTPWCIGLESGASSGWPATDWVEDIVLRTEGPEVYSQWVNNTMPFNSPPVIAAFKEFGRILTKKGYVKGNAKQAANTPYEESALGIFSRPPDCYLHRQGSNISSFFPKAKRARVDYDVFPLPSIDPKFGTPLLVAGEAIVMFNHTPESQALMEYLATPEPHEIWAGLGGFLSPHKQVSTDQYPDLVTRNIAQLLDDAEVIRFDGSALMPGYVGTDIFWAGMIEFAEGKSAEEVTKEIESSWP
ncbi:MAG: ABC transporter substrate-binding protein [Cyanobacteria bacterium P01_C01_bin.69]